MHAFEPTDALGPVALADEARQEATSQALGRAAGAAYDAWLAALPNDAGRAEAVRQPAPITRFDAATFQWRGGSNAVAFSVPVSSSSRRTREAIRSSRSST